MFLAGNAKNDYPCSRDACLKDVSGKTHLVATNGKGAGSHVRRIPSMLLSPAWKAALAAFPRNLRGIRRLCREPPPAVPGHLQCRYLGETQIIQDDSSKGGGGGGGGQLDKIRAASWRKRLGSSAVGG